MEEKKYDADAIKAWLEDYVTSEEDIDSEIERLEYLTSKMTSISAQVMTGMPRSTNASTDRMADMLSRKEELEESIRVAIAKQAETRKQIETIVRKLKHTEERTVIRLRYLDRTDWNDILEIMFGTKADFNDRYDTYRRRMYKARETALVNMAKCFEESGEPIPAISTI